MICQHCNTELNPNNKFCSNCGNPIPEINAENNTLEEKEVKNNKKKLIIIGAIVVIIIIAFSAITNTLSSDEKWAVENCEYLISILKNPDSFKLYDDIIILTLYNENNEIIDEYMYIHCGGTNSYGGMVRSTSVFNHAGYVADMDDTVESNMTQNQIANMFMMTALDLLYSMNGNAIQEDGSRIEKTIISQEKVSKALGLK